MCNPFPTLASRYQRHWNEPTSKPFSSSSVNAVSNKSRVDHVHVTSHLTFSNRKNTECRDFGFFCWPNWKRSLQSFERSLCITIKYNDGIFITRKVTEAVPSSPHQFSGAHSKLLYKFAGCCGTFKIIITCRLLRGQYSTGREWYLSSIGWGDQRRQDFLRNRDSVANVISRYIDETTLQSFRIFFLYYFESLKIPTGLVVHESKHVVGPVMAV